MKVRDAIGLLQKQNLDNELFFNSPFVNENIPIGAVYENNITEYTFPDGKTYSFIPPWYDGLAVELGLTNKVVTVLTDEIR